MNTGFRHSPCARLFFAPIVATLLLVPISARAQKQDTATGICALYHNTGDDNTADGYYALFSNLAAYDNTAIGTCALYANTTGWCNSANGAYALYSNVSGYTNTANGAMALFANYTGYSNTANGYYALFDNNAGCYNTATGASALYANYSGWYNTANGAQALYSNFSGYSNTANGYYALYANNSGGYNTASGASALQANISGSDNTANGTNALYSNTTGSSNTANGFLALFVNKTGSNNTANGCLALVNTTGSNNIALGYGSGQGISSGSNNIAIGNNGAAADAGVIRIGTYGTQIATYIAGISGVTASGGVAVYINSNGQLGTLTSSRRFKNDINDMGAVSEKLMNLRPVTFRYKDTAERGTHALQYGLIAEEVAKVYPNLVQYDKAGKPFTVYYHLLVPMLLNELQKEHRRSEAQKTEIGTQRTEIVALKAALQKQSSDLTSLKQTQAQQIKVLAKLATFVQTSQIGEPLQKAVFVQR